MENLESNNNNNNNLVSEEIWNQAFEGFIKKNKIEKINPKDKIRQIKNGGMFISFCKICNKEIKLSSSYTGNYPLCYQHRDPNLRNK